MELSSISEPPSGLYFNIAAEEVHGPKDLSTL